MYIIILSIWLVGYVVSCALFEYTAEFWVLFFAVKTIEIPLWATLLGGVFTYGYIFPVALITWIVGLAI